MNSVVIKNAILWSVGGAAALGILWLILKFALPVIFPFVLAYALSCAAVSGGNWLMRVTGIDEKRISWAEKLWRAVVLIAVIALVVLFVWFALSALLRETGEAIQGLANAVGSAEDGPIEKLISTLAARFGFDNLGGAVRRLAEEAVGKSAEAFSAIATKAAASLPAVLFGGAVTAISLFYFTFGRERAVSSIKKLIPQKSRKKICKFVSQAMRGIGKFARAYLVIVSVTSAELLLGFLILGIDRAVILALFVGLIDIFPVLGVGTVLVPFSVYSFAVGNVFRGVGLLVLWAVILAVRQPLEARLIGKSAGVHPIFALVAVYAGFRLAGVIGMIGAPLTLSAVRSAAGERIK